MTGQSPHRLSTSPAGAAGASPDTPVICTILTAPAMERLRRVCTGHFLSELARPDHSDTCRRADVLCVDPLLVHQNRSLLTQVTALASAGIPCVLYTEPTPRALQAVAGMLGVSPARLLLHGVDDTSEALATLMTLSGRGRHGMELLRALNPLTAALPPGVRETLEQVQRMPHRFFDAEDVARRAGLSRRHVDRLLNAHRLAPAKSWVVASRAFHGVRRLAGGRTTIAAVASELGYADEKALRRHVTAVWGLAPQEAAGRDAGSLLGRVISFVADDTQMARLEPG